MALKRGRANAARALGQLDEESRIAHAQTFVFGDAARCEEICIRALAPVIPFEVTEKRNVWKCIAHIQSEAKPGMGVDDIGREPFADQALAFPKGCLAKEHGIMSRVGRQRGRKMDRLAKKELMDEEYPHVSRRHPYRSFRTGSDLSLYGFTPQVGPKASVAVEQIAGCGGLNEALFKPLNQRRQVKARLHERAPQPLFRGSIRMDAASQTDYRARPTTPFPMRPASPRVEFGSGVSATRLAAADFVHGFTLWRLWISMGWQDIKQRYRRSMLGPFWLTLSMAIMIGALGFLYGQLFGIELSTYMPFLTLGFIIWGFVSSVITDGCLSLIAAEGFIRQVRLPFTLHALRCVWRNLIMLAHNALVFVPVAIIFQIWPGWPALLLIPGMLLLIINAVWVTLLLGAVCARFRDIPPIAASLVQIAFFLTPIIWMPELLRERVMFAEANPFYHFVEMVRAPLLGIVPQMQTYNVVIGVTMVGWAVTWLFFRRFRCRLAYWI